MKKTIQQIYRVTEDSSKSVAFNLLTRAKYGTLAALYCTCRRHICKIISQLHFYQDDIAWQHVSHSVNKWTQMRIELEHCFNFIHADLYWAEKTQALKATLLIKAVNTLCYPRLGFVSYCRSIPVTLRNKTCLKRTRAAQFAKEV